MVAAGNSRTKPDLRKKTRQTFHYSATVLTDDNTRHPCTVLNISEAGARIVLDDDCELPERFVLLFSRSGGARRLCRKVWRDGLNVGVEFPVPHG
jgi:PilZ domain